MVVPVPGILASLVNITPEKFQVILAGKRQRKFYWLYSDRDTLKRRRNAIVIYSGEGGGGRKRMRRRLSGIRSHTHTGVRL